jgi:two-component system response regulator NreC
VQKIRVLVVDDHTIVRDGIRALLALVADIEVVGEAGNGKEALEQVRQCCPDVVLMDIAMPVMDGLEATRRIRREFPDTKVLMLTQYNEGKEYVFSAIEAGAQGFIVKAAASSDLVSGIRAIYRGESFLSPIAAKAFVEDYQRTASVRTKNDPYQQLTDREREVLKLLAEGYSAQEIAESLVLSTKTVEGYKASLMSKLDIHNRTELIKYAIRKKIVEL